MNRIERFFLTGQILDSLENNLKSAGIEKELHSIIMRLLIINFVLSFFVLFLFFKSFLEYRGVELVISLISYYIISFFLSFVVLIILFAVYINLRKYNRKKQIEDVLPDYLQLVATNIGSGMTTDQALWYAVRKKFGILANEMELVAKKMMGGVDLNEALMDFSNKYDSDILRKSMVLLIEGSDAGGEVAELIGKISWNIKDTQLMRKEVSADVTTYVIFIAFAGLIAAPLLFALAHRIIIVMADVTSKMDFSNVASVGTKLPIQNIGKGLNADDFKMFSYACLTITGLFSSMIISSVRKGNIKEGVKTIPVFIIIAVVLFLVFSMILTYFFGGLGM
ncbi:MAG: type II secretion system F family protein [Nanoarchaeota archaeon]|nr:type II secretion system F family protein [Nanoarchaeota archaeon]